MLACLFTCLHAFSHACVRVSYSVFGSCSVHASSETPVIHGHSNSHGLVLNQDRFSLGSDYTTTTQSIKLVVAGDVIVAKPPRFTVIVATKSCPCA